MENLREIKDFFEKIGFNFEKDLKPVISLSFPVSELYKYEELTDKLKNNLFIFDTKKQDLHTSFYLLTAELEPDELTALRLYIWNESKHDLYFVYNKIENNDKISDFSMLLYLSSINPKETDLDTKAQIASFKGRDDNLIEKISKTHFTTGALWLAYAEKLEKFKNKKDGKSIDKSLIETLRLLRIELDKIYKPLLDNYKNKGIEDKENIVAALIDRTLFIKFLEDKHIINSTFYETCFGDKQTNYKKLLENKDKKNINKLFKIINDVFNNSLFETPNIVDEDLLDKALSDIYNAIAQTKLNVLSLFDFRFDVLPTDFIGHIYEMFFTEAEQAKGGIFYTPKNLAQLIVNQTITSVETVLDPACGSGMFLVMAYRKLLELSKFKPTKDVAEIIKQRNKLIKNNIFGIEKESKARRIAVFSLYLEILDNIDNKDIENYVNKKILKHKETLFSKVTFPPVFPIELNFSENVLVANSLVAQDKQPHKDKTFGYIIGNPPFQTKGYGEEERDFLDKYSLKIGNELTIKISDIVVGGQLSQAFMAKIKDWAKPTTRFGFVQNSTNFDNEIKNFTNFFFTHYKIEKFYDLSNLRDILFENTKETVCVTLFRNANGEANSFQYLCPELNKFSKAFKLILQNESKVIEIQQADLLAARVRMRDYAVGNVYDKELVEKIRGNSINLKNKIENIYTGLTFVSAVAVCNYFKITEQKWESLDKKEQKQHKENFRKLFVITNEEKEKLNNHDETLYSFIEGVSDMQSFRLSNHELFLRGISPYFHRPTTENQYVDEKVFCNRITSNKKIKAFFTKEKIYCSADIFVIRLKNSEDYHFITALLNSNVVNYFMIIKELKRANDNQPKYNKESIKSIPIPKNLDNYLVAKITALSQEFCNGNRNYQGEDFERLNELVFDLYELDILEINRIKDFFAEKRGVTIEDFSAYKMTLLSTIKYHFEEIPSIEVFMGEKVPFNMVVVALYFNELKEQQPNAKKMAQGLLQEMLHANIDEPLISMQKIFYGLNCIYIFKENLYVNWTQTQAHEDGQEIMKTTEANATDY